MEKFSIQEPYKKNLINNEMLNVQEDNLIIKDNSNVSYLSKDIGMNDILDQIGNLMKKFAVEVNTKEDISRNDGKTELNNTHNNEDRKLSKESNSLYYLF